METLVYSGITVVILIVWFLLESKVMTPFDIMRKWESDMTYISPEDIDLRLAKTAIAIEKCNKIIEQGPNTDAAVEAVEVRMKLKNYQYHIRSGGV